MGTNLFSIIEDDKDVIAKGYLPEHKSGKVQIGQKAIIKLNSFPEKEYGSITGIVSSISDIPVNENYLITLRLPNGLKTSFKKEFPYKASYNGVCNIVTEDLRLVERLFYEVKSVFANN
ncbi:MAG TPA: HlyD family secretion protein [Saprospiraceae bacterium]|nr:HlyD family secretion protein [Saprospiraceae bacterium]